MGIQNLISAELAPEVKSRIIKNLTEVKSDLHFLISLQNEVAMGLYKAGTNYLPFIDRAHQTILEHPGIMPGVFDTVEFKKDYKLSKDLVPIANMVNQLAESLGKTQMAVDSDALAASLEVYSAVKLNKDKVPGLNVVATELGEFFRRGKRKSPPPSMN